MSYIVLNPTSENEPEHLGIAPRLDVLHGKTVGIISNGKEGSAGYFAHLERKLQDTFNVGSVIVRRKSNFSAPAEASIIKEAASWDIAITGIGD